MGVVLVLLLVGAVAAVYLAREVLLDARELQRSHRRRDVVGFVGMAAAALALAVLLLLAVAGKG